MVRGSRIFAILYLAGAVIMVAAGAGLVWTYIWEAVIKPWGQPDRSLLFWLLFLPMIGLQMIGAGVTMILVRNKRG